LTQFDSIRSFPYFQAAFQQSKPTGGRIIAASVFGKLFPHFEAKYQHQDYFHILSKQLQDWWLGIAFSSTFQNDKRDNKLASFIHLVMATIQ
jgi:hypothetical protein